MPGLHQVILPWPYDTLTEDEVRAIAYKALDEAANGLTVSNHGIVEIES